MTSCELVTFVTALACTISQMYTAEELAVIAAVFSQLGDTLETIQAQQELCESKCCTPMKDSTEDDNSKEENSYTEDTCSSTYSSKSTFP